MLQSGFDPAVARVIGTPVDPVLRDSIQARPGPLPPTDHAAALLDALWNTELSMSERDSLFVKAAPVLEGMVLTKPPTGGFSTAARSVIVGAGPGGAEFSTRLNSTVFLQPGYPDKYVDVGPADAVAVSEVAPPFRTADCKTRLHGNPMTVARFDQEGAAAAARMASVMEAADPPVGPEYPPEQPLAQTQTQTQPQTQPQPQPQPQIDAHAAHVPPAPETPPGPTTGVVRNLASAIQEATGVPLQPVWALPGRMQGPGPGPGPAPEPTPTPGPVPGPTPRPTPSPSHGSHGSGSASVFPYATAPVPAFVQQLKGWWADVTRSPTGFFAKDTWTTNNQWEPIVILLACLVVVIILIACLVPR